MDILIILLTIVGGFALFIGVIFLILKFATRPTLKEDAKNLYTKVGGRVRYPGGLNNPNTFSGGAR